ncbi:Zinc finger, PMZ-type [Sesbania bispinosa]|nr:Zinc finger, PMZ-type [Sesbania bispinosa]
MDEFCEGSCVNLDDDNIDINVTGDEFDVNHSEDENDSGGPSVEEELGRMDHRGKRMEDLTPVDIRNMEFASEEHGEIFYRAYAKRHGFVVRKDEIDRDIKGNVIMRQFVCKKEGSRNKKHLMRVDRKKEHRPLTRLDCQAKIRIRLDYKTDKWKVVSFVETHNHELTPSTFVHLLPSNRGLNNVDKAQVGRLHAYGVRTCHIMGYMLDQKGGYGSLGFCRKDLYNYIERQKLEKIKDGDAHSALCYIQAKANNDPTFRASFLASEDAAVVTDGDSSMREASKQVAMYSNFTEDQFELFWKRMVAKHGLVGNKWVSKIYENRSLWATAYFRDKFFGRIRTTSQCEAINSLVKAYVNKKDTIVEFINRFEKVLREYRNNEMIADFKNLFTEPVLTTSLRKIESEASKIFTLEIFREVKSEIEVAGALNVNERLDQGDKLIFKMSHYCNRGSEFQVEYDVMNSKFVCECRLFESRGIPCSHIICVIKNENMQTIPSSLIVRRWTKKCKSDLISSYQSEDVDNDVMKEAHLGAVGGAFQRLGLQTSSEKIVKDPAVVKTKGAPPKRKDQQKMDDENEDEGNISLDEVNVDGMEPSDQTQRLNNNEVNVKISGRHKEKEKDCTQDVEVKVSGTHEGKEKGCTQQVEVKVSGSHDGKARECTQNVSLNHNVGNKGKEKEKICPIAPSFMRPFHNYIFCPGMPSQMMHMPHPQYGYVPMYPTGYPMVYPNMVMQNPQWFYRLITHTGLELARLFRL